MMKPGSPKPSSPAAMLQDLPATSGERRASGKAARKRVGRSTLGSWAEADRRHDALETILAQNKIRVPELVPIRHQRMAASPWNYYRGAAAVMAADLASQPRQRADGAAVRGRSRAELRPVGHAGAEPVVRPARLRRDPARPVRVGRQAFCRQSGGGSAGERDQAGHGRCRGHRRGRGLPQAHAPVRDDARARHLVRQHACRQLDQVLRAGRPRPGFDPHREEAQAPHQPGRVRQTHRDDARAPPDNRGSPGSRHGSATTSRPNSSTTSSPDTG